MYGVDRGGTRASGPTESTQRFVLTTPRLSDQLEVGTSPHASYCTPLPPRYCTHVTQGGTPGTSREIYSEDVDDGSRTRK